VTRETPETDRQAGPVLPRRIGDRVLLAVAAVPILVISGVLLAGLLWAGSSKLRWWQHLLMSEMLSMALVLSGLAVVWAVATPTAIEQRLRTTSMRVAVLSTIAAFGALLWGASVLIRY